MAAYCLRRLRALFFLFMGLAAFGAAVFNQLMEIEPDSRMQRTADRPLPSGRVSPSAAFGIGWLLSAMALIHLTIRVNMEAAALTALTHLAEQGLALESNSWNGVLTRAGTADTVVSRLHEAIQRALAAPAVVQAFQAQLVGGNRPLLDVLDAYQRLHQSRLDLAQLVLGEVGNHAKVAHITGRLAQAGARRP